MKGQVTMRAQIQPTAFRLFFLIGLPLLIACGEGATEPPVPQTVEGEGIHLFDGSSSSIVIEGEEADFEGVAELVSVTGDAPDRVVRIDVTDEDGLVETVDVVEGETDFDDDGDLTTFEAFLAELEAGTVVEVDGEGIRQLDSSIRATELKAEIE